MSMVVQLPDHVAEKVRFVFGEDIGLPEVTVVSNYGRSFCVIDDDKNVYIQVRLKDYDDELGAVLIHELGHWYHCTRWPNLSEECEWERAEAVSLFMEMVVFLDPDSPYFSPKWLYRLKNFDRKVIFRAFTLLGEYDGEYDGDPDILHDLIWSYLRDAK